MGLLIFLITLLVAVTLAVLFAINGLWQTLRTGLPFVTTPPWAIDWLTANLQLKSNDRFYELGCGDARVIAGLAKKFPDARFTGIEIQWWPYLLARWRTRKFTNVQILHGDVFRQQLGVATVVYGFYITKFAPKIADKLRQELRPGTRVFSFGFPLAGWAEQTRIAPPHGIRGSTLLQYQA